MATASSASATLLTNTYDATGMRVRKVAGSTTSRFVRGLGAELLQEITGSTRRNYIYANGVPVAQLNGTTLHYLHTDQRGAPVKATNASKTVRWSTRYEPFGATVGLTNPGSLVMNLRLPGQYADSESGLYDNGFRTYNPTTGRYLQSDPIGLSGGVNTYGYVTGNPFRWVDPSGLNAGRLIFVAPFIYEAFALANMMNGYKPKAYSGNVSGADSSSDNNCQCKNGAVYRGDKSSYSIGTAFTSGFTPKGNSVDLKEHLWGSTDSGFVSTSKSRDIASGFAGKNGNVFVICSDRGIDANAALGALSPYPEQQEVAFSGGIMSSEIMGAHTKTSGSIGPFIPNPNYMKK